jgi:transcriptional regulator with XRE-family HTH domain
MLKIIIICKNTLCFFKKRKSILTREQLAKLLNVSRPTLNSWEKEKPELVRLINQGLALDEQIDEVARHLEKLKEIKEKADTNKFRLK